MSILGWRPSGVDPAGDAINTGAAIREERLLEPMVRRLLEELAAHTGMESVYLTRINWRTHEQEIKVAANLAPASLWIPEEVKLDYSDAVCRYVLDGGPTFTDDVPLTFPESLVGQFMRFQSFVSVPLELEDGEVYGTLCGASTQRIALDDAQLEEVRRDAHLIAGWLEGVGRGRAASGRT